MALQQVRMVEFNCENLMYYSGLTRLDMKPQAGKSLFTELTSHMASSHR